MNTRSNQEMNSFKQTICVNKLYASSHDQVPQRDFVVYYPVTVISISGRAASVGQPLKQLWQILLHKFNRTWSWEILWRFFWHRLDWLYTWPITWKAKAELTPFCLLNLKSHSRCRDRNIKILSRTFEGRESIWKEFVYNKLNEYNKCNSFHSFYPSMDIVCHNFAWNSCLIKLLYMKHSLFITK